MLPGSRRDGACARRARHGQPGPITELAVKQPCCSRSVALYARASFRPAPRWPLYHISSARLHCTLFQEWLGAASGSCEAAVKQPCCSRSVALYARVSFWLLWGWLAYQAVSAVLHCTAFHVPVAVSALATVVVCVA